MIKHFILFALILVFTSVNLYSQDKDPKAKIKMLEGKIKGLENEREANLERIKQLENDIKELGGTVPLESSTVPPREGTEWESEIDKCKSKLEAAKAKEKVLSDEINKLNRTLTQNKKQLADNSRRIRELEGIEQNLRNTVSILEGRVKNLEGMNRELRDTLGKAENNIAGLVEDTISLNNTIRAKDLQIYNLEQDTVELKSRIRALKYRIVVLEGRIDDLIETIVKLNKEKEAAENKNTIDMLSLINTYGGINYSLYNGSHILPMERQLSSDFTLTFYNLFVGTGFFFQIPTRYQNYTGSLTTVRETQHYLSENLDVYVQELDITGNPAYSYIKPTYAETQGDFRIFNYGVNLSVARNFYLIAGLTNVRGTTWDLYSGDLDAYGLLGNNAIAPQKYNDHYIVNFEELRVNKGMIGVASTFTIENRIDLDVKKIKTKNRERENGSNNFRGEIQEYDYKYGFQVELGYNWLYEDVFVNVGLHVRLWDYKEENIFPPFNRPGEGKNDGFIVMNKGYEVFKEAKTLNDKKEELTGKLDTEENKNKRKRIKKEIVKIEKELKVNPYKKSNELLIKGLNIFINQLEAKADDERINLYLEIIEYRDRVKENKGDSEYDELFKLTDTIVDKIKNYENFAFCLRDNLSLENIDVKDDKERHEKIREGCKTCVKENAAFLKILKEEFSDSGKSVVNEKILNVYFLEQGSNKKKK